MFAVSEKLRLNLTTLRDTKLSLDKTIEMLELANVKNKKQIELLTAETQLQEACAEFFNQTIDVKVDEVSAKIEEIINRGISYVYGGNYVFQLNKTIKRNRTMYCFELKNLETGVSGFEETYYCYNE